MSDTTLVDMTKVAADKVIELAGGAPERAFLHVFPAGQGCCRAMFSLAFMPEAGDNFEVVDAHGVKVAVLAEAREAVEGVSIDYVETPEGEGFVVMKPNPSGGCGCHGSG